MSAMAEDLTPTTQPNWVWLSTHETIEKEIPSITAIVETIIAVPVYWWIATHVGMFWPLALSALVAPFVLLRSDPAEKLGIKWFLTWEKPTQPDPQYSMSPRGNFIVMSGIIYVVIAASMLFWFEYAKFVIAYTAIFSFFMLIVLAIMRQAWNEDWKNRFFRSDIFDVIINPLALLIASIGIRFGASFVCLRHGFLAMPKNFRRVTFCTSPFHVPELVPGLERTNSIFRITQVRQWMMPETNSGRSRMVGLARYIAAILILYTPAWLYRFTIKSTAWFWWPLAFLGGELKQATNPKMFHWKVMGSLWAKASIGVAIGTIVAFATANIYPALLSENPLLTPFGYLLSFEWTIRPPSQILALLGAVLSVWIVLRINDASGEYRIAEEQGDASLLRAADRKFGRTEFLARVRLLVFIAFWIVVAVHALLYFNSKQCWFDFSPELNNWAVGVYGERLPRPCQ